MRLLLTFLLISQIAFSQVSVKDMMQLYQKRTDSFSVISSAKSMGFKNVSYTNTGHETVTVLNGLKGKIILWKDLGVISNIEYMTQDNFIYKSWGKLLEGNGFEQVESYDKEPSIYLSEKYIVLVYNKEGVYSLVISKKP